jgi:putative photosynthetic complex assembly protein
MAGITSPLLPNKAVSAAFAALLGLVVVIGVMRVAGFKPDATLPLDVAPAEQSRVLRFDDGSDGSVTVRDAKTGAIIDTFYTGEGAFVRSTVRALVNDRRRKGVTSPGDFRLEIREGAKVYLIDETTQRVLALNAFGPSNSAVFAAFMSNQKGEGQ